VFFIIIQLQIIRGDLGGAGVQEFLSEKDLKRTLRDLEKKMYQAAEDLNFEEAAKLRDRIRGLERGGL
jgi:excinuclease UvrABC nuclease subunit